MGFLQECQTNMNSTKKGKGKSIVYEMCCVESYEIVVMGVFDGYKLNP